MTDMRSLGLKAKVSRTADALLPTLYGSFHMYVYEAGGVEHVALVCGDVQDSTLLRIHSSCLTGDAFHSLRCDCGEQLEASMRMIQKNGHGIVLYLNQEGRGIGLTQKIRAYALQERGYDTVEANEMLGLPADARDYSVAAQILSDLGVQRVRLLTNNPDKVHQMQASGIEVVERIPLEIAPNGVNKKYLKTKKDKMSHRLTHV